jgi:hypothetical protein
MNPRCMIGNLRKERGARLTLPLANYRNRRASLGTMSPFSGKETEPETMRQRCLRWNGIIFHGPIDYSKLASRLWVCKSIQFRLGHFSSRKPAASVIRSKAARFVV